MTAPREEFTATYEDNSYKASTTSTTSTTAEADPTDQSLGTIVSQLSSDFSKLMRQEVALAKAEMREEGKKAGKAAGMLGGAGLGGWMLLLFLSLTVMYALGEAMDLVWAALIVTALWAVIAAVLFMSGRKKMREVNPKPERTVQTLKEDKEWARHPTS